MELTRFRQIPHRRWKQQQPSKPTFGQGWLLLCPNRYTETCLHGQARAWASLRYTAGAKRRSKSTPEQDLESSVRSGNDNHTRRVSHERPRPGYRRHIFVLGSLTIIRFLSKYPGHGSYFCRWAIEARYLCRSQNYKIATRGRMQQTLQSVCR